MFNFNKSEYEKLQKEWKEARKYQSFVDDGILIEEKYCKTKPRIAFLLKESNDNFVNIRGKGWGPYGNSPLFWRNINIWLYVITKLWNNEKPNIEEIDEIKEQVVDSIAYINIKKNAESKPVSDENDLINYAQRDKDFLIRQIELINPQVIVCNGTLFLFNYLYELKQITNKIYLANNRLIIDFYHPSYKISYEDSFKELTDILNNEKVKKEIQNLKN